MRRMVLAAAIRAPLAMNGLVLPQTMPIKMGRRIWRAVGIQECLCAGQAAGCCLLVAVCAALAAVVG